MFWGCLTFVNVGKIIKVKNKITSEEYCNTLSCGLFVTLEKYILKLSDYIFLQDNTSFHISKETINWLKTNNIKFLNWSAISPDLNIIENVWYFLKTNLKKYSTLKNKIIL